MAEETKYADLTVDELGAELEKRGLKKSGKKDELIARLEDDDTAQGGTAPEDEVVEEPVAEEAPAEEKPARRRRGSAETSTAPSAAPSAPTRADGTVMVRARARYVRSAPRKARLVMDHIRGKQVDQARAILDHTPRAVSSDILKLLNSAVANAENNFELDVDDLKIDRAYVDEGPTIKRYRPRALGRATQIKKRTSHMTIELTTKERA